jgi:flagellar hook protein FlgE
MEGDTTVATGQISFIAGSANPGEETVSFKYSPKGAAPFDLKFDFSAATGYDTGSSTGSTGGMNPLAVASQDGYDAGAITSMTFDEDGHLSLSYANGQTTKGPQLALARFESTQSLAQQGHGEFTAADASSARMGRANDAGMGKIEAGRIEMSNVDLSGEFSNLIVMQRGYQASSTVVSTANDMLQQLFQMHGNR